MTIIKAIFWLTCTNTYMAVLHKEHLTWTYSGCLCLVSLFRDREDDWLSVCGCTDSMDVQHSSLLHALHSQCRNRRSSSCMFRIQAVFLHSPRGKWCLLEHTPPWFGMQLLTSKMLMWKEINLNSWETALYKFWIFTDSSRSD